MIRNGEFLLGNRQYCYPLTVTDHRSRCQLIGEGLESTQSKFAFSVFGRTFRDYGLPENFECVLDRFLTIKSYPFMDSLDRYDEFVADMIRWRSEGRMHLEECIYDGLDRAAEALCSLLDGKHIGKPLVKLGD